MGKVRRCIRFLSACSCICRSLRFYGKRMYDMPDLVNQGSASFFFLVGVNRINRTNLRRLTVHTFLSTIHIPIVSAAISGKIISFSPISSETPTINKIINKAQIYRLRWTGSLNNCLLLIMCSLGKRRKGTAFILKKLILYFFDGDREVLQTYPAIWPFLNRGNKMNFAI